MELVKAIEKLRNTDIYNLGHNDRFEELRLYENAIDTVLEELNNIESKRKNGTLSDGYHTYNDLYYQRCILFATICNANKNLAWKSKRHSDGKKCFDSDNWFIVGIDTPKGSYTYHYEMKYWDLFKVTELENGKIWDGHTEKDVTRLLSLEELNNSISKDKIENKIKELKEKLENVRNKEDRIRNGVAIIVLEYCIDSMNELLNKE